MNHNSNIQYGYSTSPDYYMEGSEGFIADYSDNEGLQDNRQILQAVPFSNVTEIYSRNNPPLPVNRHMVSTNETRYGQNIQQCYYENVHRPQPPRTHVAVPYQNYNQVYDPRLHQYCPISTSSQHDANYDTAAFRSAHHNMAQGHPVGHCKTYPENVHSPENPKAANLKRYPITVGTPKYYRRPPVNSVYKRPSALCLPVPSQPDPAACRRPKKTVGNETHYNFQQGEHLVINNPSNIHPLRNQIDPKLIPHKMDSEGDVNKKILNLEDMLDKFERENETPKNKSKSDINKFAKYLKPKVPSSVKARQERMRQKSTKFCEKSVETVLDSIVNNNKSKEVSDTTTDSLEKLLTQLKKCEMASKESLGKGDMDTNLKRKIETNNEGNDSNAEKAEATDDEFKLKTSTSKSTEKSFNYQDITNQMLRSKSEGKSFKESPLDSSSQCSIQDITKRLTSSLTNTTSQKPKGYLPKPRLDDNCALELHRSKSYIVNLIDRALSKELGTVPSERGRKDFDNMNPKKAVDMMSRHTCGKSNKELCLEITSALTDSIISNATAPPDAHSTPSYVKSKICCCNSEEPTYIKQLKQLRWGHLKHIQREVRRLEDLERFLDSCSSTTIPEI